MRGERLGMLHVCVFKTGSSPHARGTQVSNHPTMDPKRFIPACAGNAKQGVANENKTAVHPRMRGERCTPGTFNHC